jgi:hypothetical protein
VAVPSLGGSSVVSILMSVLLPAPFGPSNPNVLPGAQEKFRWSTATSVPNRRVRERISMALELELLFMDIAVYI